MKQILVIGAMMLDHYVIGEANRLSPEAPVPVLEVKEERNVLGGAANVANNIAALNMPVAICCLLGMDENGEVIKSLLEEAGIVNLNFSDPNYQTIVKSRVLSGSQQLLRIDRENIVPVSDVYLRHLLNVMNADQVSFGYVLVSDYGKGLCTKDTFQILRELKKNGKDFRIFIDPKGTDWEKYRGFDLIKPNFKELNEVLGSPIQNVDEEIVKAARELLQRYHLGALLVTRSEKGMTYVSNDDAIHISSEAKSVFDVTGAGDTVLAVFTAAIASGLSLEDSLIRANKAAGYVVSKSGTTVITDTLLQAL